MLTAQRLLRALGTAAGHPRYGFDRHSKRAQDRDRLAWLHSGQALMRGSDSLLWLGCFDLPFAQPKEKLQELQLRDSLLCKLREYALTLRRIEPAVTKQQQGIDERARLDQCLGKLRFGIRQRDHGAPDS